MDNNNFVIKNSILLTICCFIILNLRNIVLFNFNDDNNIGFTAFFYTFTIVALIAIIAIAKLTQEGRTPTAVGSDTEGGRATNFFKNINNVFKYIHGKDNFIPPIKEGFMRFLIILLPFLFIIMGSITGSYARLKMNVKNSDGKVVGDGKAKFSPIRNIVLGILMFSVMFLFFQIIFTSIVNNVTKTQLNTNFNLYMFLFLFLLFLYSIFYCVFVKKQTNEKINDSEIKT